MVHPLGATMNGVLLVEIVASSRSLAATPAGFEIDRLVAWFTAATYAQDGDCPDGLNPSIDGIYRNALNNLGVSPDEVERLYKKYQGTTGGEERLKGKKSIGLGGHIQRSDASEGS